jgi:hypothetical protein
MKTRLLGLALCLCVWPALAINESETIPQGAIQLPACTMPPFVGLQVTFQSTAASGSGYHDHNANRPQGHFDAAPYYSSSPGGPSTVTRYSGSDGCAYVWWYAPQISGYYDIVAYSSAGNTYHSIIVWTMAQTSNLIELPASSNYTAVGQTSNHLLNHYGTASAISTLQNIFSIFRAQTGIVGSVNDMSLGWGGDFDLGPSTGTLNCPLTDQQFWTNVCRHAEHRLGKNADIPFSGLGTGKPAFLDIANRNGGAGGGPILDEGNHYHLRFAY